MLAGLVGVAFFLFEAPEVLPRMSGLHSRALALDNPNHASPLLVLILTVPLAFYLFAWAKFAFPMIPEQSGGAEPKYGYFSVWEEHIADAQLVGSKVDEEHRDSQGLRLIWEGSDYVIFESDHDGLVGSTKVSDQLVFAWVPYEITGIVPNFRLLSAPRSQSFGSAGNSHASRIEDVVDGTASSELATSSR